MCSLTRSLSQGSHASESCELLQCYFHQVLASGYGCAQLIVSWIKVPDDTGCTILSLNKQYIFSPLWQLPQSCKEREEILPSAKGPAWFNQWKKSRGEAGGRELITGLWHKGWHKCVLLTCVKGCESHIIVVMFYIICWVRGR